MIYSIDTSALIHGWQKAYPPNAFPMLWNKLDELIMNNSIVATEEVLRELSKKDDEIYKWAKERPEMFIKIDEDIQLIVSEILSKHKKLLDTRNNRSSADPFVIALARIKTGTVITNEGRTYKLKRPNIPDVCDAMGIRCIDMLQLIKEQNWVFK